MSQFDYVDLGAGLSPAPIVTMTIYPPEWERDGKSDELVYSCTAFLDTGSDCNLLPQEAISALKLTTFKANTLIIGVAGGQMEALGCYVDISIGDRNFAAVRAYACQMQDLNGHAIMAKIAQRAKFVHLANKPSNYSVVQS